MHEKYDGKFDYNLALIKTKSQIRLGVNAKVIDLATITPALGSEVQLCGWGTVSIFDVRIYLYFGVEIYILIFTSIIHIFR